MTITGDIHASVREPETAGADLKLPELIVRTISQADVQLTINADPVVLRLERRLLAYLVAAVLIILAVIRYLWHEVRHVP